MLCSILLASCLSFCSSGEASSATCFCGVIVFLNLTLSSSNGWSLCAYGKSGSGIVGRDLKVVRQSLEIDRSFRIWRSSPGFKTASPFKRFITGVKSSKIEMGRVIPFLLISIQDLVLCVNFDASLKLSAGVIARHFIRPDSVWQDVATRSNILFHSKASRVRLVL